MRKLFFALLFLIASLSYLFEVDELLIKKFSFFNDLKISYINKVINISSSIEKHFNQIQTIEQLKAQNNELKEYKILYTSTQKQLNTLKDFLVSVELPQSKSTIELVKVLSKILTGKIQKQAMAFMQLPCTKMCWDSVRAPFVE